MDNKIIRYFIKHSVVTNWIMLVICIAGIFALFNLNRIYLCLSLFVNSL